MSHSQVLKTEIESTLRPGPSKRGNNVLRSVTNLFVDRADAYSDEQIEVFDVVMQCLLSHAERDAKVELSARLAPVHRAPAKVVRTLLRDRDPAISSPMLQQSRAISDVDLTALIDTAEPELLLTIARREFINKAVTEQLINRGIPEVTHSVLENSGAEISETSFVKMIGDCGTDTELGPMLDARTDLPEELRPFLDSYKPQPRQAPKLIKTGR